MNANTPYSPLKIPVFPNTSKPSPQNARFYPQSPILVKDSQNSDNFHSPLKHVFSRPLSYGNASNLIGPKALTSLFTKKVDVKAHMKVVRRYKEELMITHEEYIQQIQRFIKELELELKENLGALEEITRKIKREKTILFLCLPILDYQR